MHFKKRALRGITMAMLAAGLLVSCETEIDINSTNQNVPIVYCVLNSADSFQYVRIEKTYLIDQAALTTPPNPDSLYFGGEIVVNMERWLGGKVMESVRFYPTTDIPKDSGFFPNDKNIIYKARLSVIPKSMYRLYIYLGSKEKVLYAQATSLGNLTVIDPIDLPQRKISLYNGNNYTCRWEPVANAGMYQVVVRFDYQETLDGVTEKKSLNWPQGFVSAGSNVEYLSNDISGARFMHILQENLPVVDGITRKALGIDFSIVSGSLEMKYYIESTSPSEGALMEKPVYTNITNGLGLFSCVSRIDIDSLILSSVTIDSIAYGQFTRTLGFLDHTNDRDSTNNY